jgi:hypothetical protein
LFSRWQPMSLMLASSTPGRIRITPRTPSSSKLRTDFRSRERKTKSDLRADRPQLKSSRPQAEAAIFRKRIAPISDELGIISNLDDLFVRKQSLLRDPDKDVARE